MLMKGPDHFSSGEEKNASPASATSATLLDQVKNGDSAGWGRLMRLYRPLLLWWCRGKVARREDAEDVAQEVLATVLAKVGEFDRQRQGSFRAWLRSITQFKLLEYWKEIRRVPVAAGGTDARDALAQWPDKLHGDATADEGAQERRIVLRSALELLQCEFEAKTWQAAMRTLAGQPAAIVAADLGMTAGAVYIAKSRVLARLRKEMGGIAD
jgi:RNA polymerase sigma-70 factor, ECF subfamily